MRLAHESGRIDREESQTLLSVLCAAEKATGNI